MTGAGESGASRRPRAWRPQDGLSQRDLASQRRMHRVLKEVVAEQAVPADRMKIGLAVDQDAAVAPATSR